MYVVYSMIYQKNIKLTSDEINEKNYTYICLVTAVNNRLARGFPRNGNIKRKKYEHLADKC